MSSKTMDERAFKEMFDRHRDLYDGPAIDPKLKGIIRDAPYSKLSRTKRVEPSPTTRKSPKRRPTTSSSSTDRRRFASSTPS